MTSAKSRRTALRKLLLQGQATTQGELCRLLADRGHPATQSTVSRDLKLLGAQRLLRDDGNFGYHLRSGGPAAFPTEMVLSVEHNEALIVLKTRTGRAQAVGLDLDGLRLPQVLGTIAGDDTVVVVPRAVAHIGELARRLRELVAKS